MADERWEFVRQRFEHARQELFSTDLSDSERLLRALIALAPLPDDDVPPPADALYRRVRNTVGSRLWRPGRESGALASSIAGLSVAERRECIERLFEASLAVERCVPGKSATGTVVTR